MQLLIYQQLEWPRTVSLEERWYRKQHKVDSIADVGDISKGLVKENIVKFLIWGKPKSWKLKNQVFCKPLILWFLFFLYQRFLSLRFFFGFIAMVDVSLAQLPMAMLLWNWNLKLDFTLLLFYAFVCSPFSVCMLPHSNISSFYIFTLGWCPPFEDKFCRTWIMFLILMFFLEKQPWWNFWLNQVWSWT